jgi:hypothetical protein
LINRILTLIFRIGQISLAWLDWLTANKRDAIHERHSKETDLTDVFVYVHWSRDSRPTRGEVELLNQTKAFGLQNVVVLNLDNFNEANNSISGWDELSSSLILRKNIGRDLGGYRAAISVLEPGKIRRILFFNNSVIWLPMKMKMFIEEFASIDKQLYSATVSYQPVKHMQSFALAAKNQGVQILIDEIKKIRNTRSKRATIAFGEIRISRNLTKKGIGFSNGFFQYSDLIKRALTVTILTSQPRLVVDPLINERLAKLQYAVANGIPLNPTHHTWLELYELGFPGVKRDLFSKNKSRIPDLILVDQKIDELDAKCIEIETIGFLVSPKSITDILRRKLGV